jgi:purine-binding chemotaxis protein CheW
MASSMTGHEAVSTGEGNHGSLETEKQLVVFDLAHEHYGVDISTVREIIRMQEITRVPQTPDFVEGLINLRGKVIPVVDLRKRFCLAVTEESKENRIVVIDIGGHDIGVVVDAVTEVLRIPAGCVEPPSSIITTVESEYLVGIAKLSSRLIILLDLAMVLSDSERHQLSHMKRLSESENTDEEIEERIAVEK